MSLFPKKLLESQKNVFSASAAVQTYSAAILRQEDVKLDCLPQLPNHQKASRQLANKWNEQVLPTLIKTNAEVIDFANGFAAFYETLIKLAQEIKVGDGSSIIKFTEGLDLLQKSLIEKEANAKFSQTELQNLKESLGVDYKSLCKDVAVATRTLEGKHGELETISKELDEITTQLNQLTGVMAGGAVGIVGGVVMVVVGSIATIETQGVASGLILAGVVALLGGISSEITGGVEFGLAVQREKDLQTKLASEKNEIGILKHVQSLIDGFATQLDNTISAIGVFQQQWRLLAEEIGRAHV